MAGAGVLLLINAVVALRLFHLEFAAHMESIEAAYISLTTYFVRHGYELTWFPLWYAGEPLHNTYPPGLMWLCKWTAQWMSWSPARAYHFVAGLEYAFGPVTAFLLAAVLSGRSLASFFGGLFYSLVNVSPILTREVRTDVGGPWWSRRMQVLERFGEGPHVLTLVLLPLAILAIHKALSTRRPLYGSLAILLLTAILLSNVMGVLAILLAVFAYLITRDELKATDWIITAGFGVVALLGTLMWIPPSMMSVISQRARMVGGDFTSAYQVAPVVFTLLFVTAAFLAYLLKRWDVESGPAFFVVAGFFFFALAYSAYYWNLSLVPMPKRYHLETDLFVPFALALLIPGLPFWRARLGATALWRARLPIAVSVAILLAGVSIYHTNRLRRWTNRVSAPIDVKQTSEYRIARQLASYGSGARVFAPGSAEFWLDTFVELPEFGGGFVQALPNQNTNVGAYLITSSDGGPPNPPDSVLWLKAFAVQRVAVTGPGSTEFYKPFQNPNKFQGLLPEVWREGGDAIYEVPLRSTELAHVVPEKDLVVHPPVNGIDVGELSRYVAALDREPNPPSVQWASPARASIRTAVKPGDAISVQVNAANGWKASVDGKRLPVESDGLGFMKIVPPRSGPLELRLEYDGGWEALLTKIISTIAILAAVAGGAFFEWARFFKSRGAGQET